MMALMVLMFFVIYFALSLWIIFSVLNWADKNKRSKWWALLAAFVMYNLIFWDLIPTRIMHRHYCDTQAGFWIYKTPEQWKAENPKIQILDPLTHLDSSRYLGKKGNSTYIFPLNLYVSRVNSERLVYSWLPIYRQEEYIQDNRTKEVLIRFVDFWSGYFNESSISNLKTWMDIGNCKVRHINISALEQVTQKFESIEKGN